jgi:glycerol kinase
MSASDACMQAQADIIQLPVLRPKMLETTALGAAIAAGIGAGIWKGVDDPKLESVNESGMEVFEPKMESKDADGLFERWEKAVEACKVFT